MRIRDAGEIRSGRKLSFALVAVTIGLVLTIYFTDFSMILQLILELVLLFLVISLAIISFFIHENLFVAMYRNFRRKAR